MNEKVQRIMGPVMDRRAAAVPSWVMCGAWLLAGLVWGSLLMSWVMP